MRKSNRLKKACSLVSAFLCLNGQNIANGADFPDLNLNQETWGDENNEESNSLIDKVCGWVTQDTKHAVISAVIAGLGANWALPKLKNQGASLIDFLSTPSYHAAGKLIGASGKQLKEAGLKDKHIKALIELSEKKKLSIDDFNRTTMQALFLLGKTKQGKSENGWAIKIFFLWIFRALGRNEHTFSLDGESINDSNKEWIIYNAKTGKKEIAFKPFEGECRMELEDGLAAGLRNWMINGDKDEMPFTRGLISHKFLMKVVDWLCKEGKLKNAGFENVPNSAFQVTVNHGSINYQSVPGNPSTGEGTIFIKSDFQQASSANYNIMISGKCVVYCNGDETDKNNWWYLEL